MLEQAQCTIPACGKPVARAGLCWAHLKRRRKGLPLHPPLQPRHDNPWDALMDSIFALQAVDPVDDDEWERRIDCFRQAVRKYMHAPKKTNQFTKRSSN